MQRTKIVYWSKCAVALAAIPVAIYAYATGPLPRNTGAPGDQTCSQSGCHLGTPVNSSNGKVEITYSGGTSYTPGERGKFTVTITDNSARRYGFQASARLASNLANGQAGTLLAGPGLAVQCADEKTPPCRDTAPIQFINHSAASTRNVFEFEWTAPADGAGNVQVYVAGNAANGNGTESGDHIYTSSITLTPATATSNRPSVRTADGALNAWSGSSNLATNTWIEIYGSNLAPSNMDWSSAPEFAQGKLPTTLNGVSVTIGGKSAPVYFTSPGQINVLVPDDGATGNLPLIVKNAAGESQAYTIQRAGLSPALLTTVGTDSKRRVVGRLNANPLVVLASTAVTGTRPFAPGEVVQFYATGLGPTTPAIPTDTVVTGAPALVNTPTIRINNVPVQILGSALVGSGLYQINGVVPDIPDGDYSAVVEVGGTSSPDSIVISIKK